jgi:hypothetical protein
MNVMSKKKEKKVVMTNFVLQQHDDAHQNGFFFP